MVADRQITEAISRAGKGDWEGAHDIVQVMDGKAAAHIHAYLHRVEGDQWNAEYWYRRAGVKVCRDSLHDELIALRSLYSETPVD